MEHFIYLPRLTLDNLRQVLHEKLVAQFETMVKTGEKSGPANTL